MSLSAVEYRSGAKSSWDWKQEYIERLANGDGLEMFSQASVTSDTMLILAGPPRIPDDGFQELLSPIGLITDVTFSSENGLRPMWEMGTDQTYFTRGKTSYQLSIGAMVANKPSLMKLMTRQSPIQDYADDDIFTSYPKAPDHAGQFWSNIDTEYTASPFGILMIFKTKGGKEWVATTPPASPKLVDIPEYVPYDTSDYIFGTLGTATLEAENKKAYDIEVARIQKYNTEKQLAYDKELAKYNAGVANADSANSSFVSAVYLENCNIGSFAFNMNSQAVTLQENVNIMFDRMLAVDYS